MLTQRQRHIARLELLAVRFDNKFKTCKETFEAARKQAATRYYEAIDAGMWEAAHDMDHVARYFWLAKQR